MRTVLFILSVAAILLGGCRSSSRAPTSTAAPTTAVPSGFRPMLMTTFGTNTSAGNVWRIGVTEKTLEFSRSFASSGNGWKTSGWTTTSPEGWTAHPGWFVFVESESRAWAFDGDEQLLLQTETTTAKDSSGATYAGHFPCAVPAEVVARLSEPARKTLEKRD